MMAPYFAAWAAMLVSAAGLSNDAALDAYIAGWNIGSGSDIFKYQAANYVFHFHGATPADGIKKSAFVAFLIDFRSSVATAGGPSSTSTDFMRTYGTVRQNISAYTIETGGFVVPGYSSGIYHAYAKNGLVELEEAIAFPIGVECLSKTPLASLPASSQHQKAPAITGSAGGIVGNSAASKLETYADTWALGNALAIKAVMSPNYNFFFHGFTPAAGVNKSGFEAFFGGMRGTVASAGGPAVDSTDFMRISGNMSRTLTGDVGDFMLYSAGFAVPGFGTGAYHAIGDDAGVFVENAVAFGKELQCMHSPAATTTKNMPPSGFALSRGMAADVQWPVLIFLALTLMSVRVQ